MERETRFELATLALARRCSTTELLPQSHDQGGCNLKPLPFSRRDHQEAATLQKNWTVPRNPGNAVVAELSIPGTAKPGQTTVAALRTPGVTMPERDPLSTLTICPSRICRILLAIAAASGLWVIIRVVWPSSRFDRSSICNTASEFWV